MNRAFVRKFWSILLLYWQETFAYRAATVIWILADAQIALLMPIVWLSAYSDRSAIFGMQPDTLVTYYLATLLLSQFVVCHLMWDIGFEIREGAFTGLLLRPFSVFWMYFARNTAWRTIKVFFFTPILLIFLIAYGGHLGHTQLYFTAPFFATLILAHLLSYVMAFSLSMSALWTTEFISVFQIYYFPEMFLSGRMIPLDAMPSWANALSSALPFKYTIALPTNVLLGRVPLQQVAAGMLVQVAWILGFLVLGQILFRRGVRQYTGFGN